MSPTDPDGKGPCVVHIKDAHANYEAQRNIRQILTVLHKNYGIKMVAVEGAGGPLDSKYLKFFADPERNRKVADYLARQGEISGADLFILDEPDARPLGIESIGDYAANLNSFRRVLVAKEESDELISYFESQLDLVMPRLLDKNLLKFVKSWEGFHIRRNELLTYVNGIGKEAAALLQIDFSKIETQVEWPFLWRILKLKELEARLDSKKIQKEQENLIQNLKEWGVSQELASEFAKLKIRDPGTEAAKQESKDSGAGWTPRWVFERLVEEAGPHGFRFADYPQYSFYAQYLVLQNEIEASRLFGEVNRLSDRLLAVLAKSKEEKEIILFIRDIRMFKKIYGLELLREDVSQLKQRSQDWMPSRMAERLTQLKEAAGVTNHKIEISSLVEKLDPLMKEVIRFYELAEKRDKILMTNTLKAMRDQGETRAVIITGGYHADGIKEQCQREGISYVCMSPKIRELDTESRYVKIMMGQPEDPLNTAHLAPKELTQPAAVYTAMNGIAGTEAVIQRSQILIDAMKQAAGPVTSDDLSSVLANPIFVEDPEAVFHLAASMGNVDSLGRRLAHLKEMLPSEPPGNWRKLFEQLIAEETGVRAGKPLESRYVTYFIDLIVAAGKSEEFYELTEFALNRFKGMAGSEAEAARKSVGGWNDLLKPFRKESLSAVRDALIRAENALSRGDSQEAFNALRPVLSNSSLIPSDDILFLPYLKRGGQADANDVQGVLTRFFIRLRAGDETRLLAAAGPREEFLIKRLRALRALALRGTIPAPPPSEEASRAIQSALAGFSSKVPNLNPFLRLLGNEKFFASGRPTPEFIRQVQQPGAFEPLSRLAISAERFFRDSALRTRQGGLPRQPGLGPRILNGVRQLREAVLAAAPARDRLPLPVLVGRVREIFPERSDRLPPDFERVAELVMNPQIVTPERGLQPDIINLLRDVNQSDFLRQFIVDAVRLVNVPGAVPQSPSGPENRPGSVRVPDLVRIINLLALVIIEPVIVPQKFAELKGQVNRPLNFPSPGELPVVPGLIEIINQNIPRLIPSLPSPVEILRLSEQLTQPAVPSALRVELARLVTNAVLVTPELKVRPEVVNLPPAVVSALRELIPVAIEALNQPNVPSVNVPGIPNPVTPVQLVNALTELNRELPSVPTVPAIQNLITQLQQTPVAPQAIEELARIVIPSLVTPELTVRPEVANQPPAVVNALRELIPVAIEALNQPNVPSVNVPGIPNPVTPAQLAAILTQVETLTNPVPSQQEITAQLAQTISAIITGITQIREALNTLSTVTAPVLSPAQTGPVNTLISELSRNVETLTQQLTQLARVPDLAPEVRQQIEILNQRLSEISLPGVVTLGNGPIATILVTPQLPRVEQGVNAVSSAVQQFSEINGLPEFPFSNLTPNKTFPNPSALFPVDRFLVTPSQAVFAVETLRREGVVRKVGLEAVVTVVRTTQSVEPALPELSRLALLEAASLGSGLRGIYAYETPVRPVVSELTEIIRETYGPLYTENHTDAGAVVIDFKNRLSTRRDVMSMVAPQTFNTKLYVRFVVYEGVDEKRVTELADWARGLLDVNGNPIGDRFDIVIAPEDKAAKFIGNIHLLRRPGRDEKTLFELLRNASPVIKNQTDFFARAVYYADQPVLREMTNLPKASWRVFYPVARGRFITDLPYMALKLARAALTREQLPESDKREFKPLPNSDLFRFVPGAELSQFLSAFAANMRRLLAAA